MAGVLRCQLNDRPDAMETLGDIIKNPGWQTPSSSKCWSSSGRSGLQVEPLIVADVVRDAQDGLEYGAKQVRVNVDEDVPNRWRTAASCASC